MQIQLQMQIQVQVKFKSKSECKAKSKSKSKSKSKFKSKSKSIKPKLFQNTKLIIKQSPDFLASSPSCISHEKKEDEHFFPADLTFARLPPCVMGYLWIRVGSFRTFAAFLIWGSTTPKKARTWPKTPDSHCAGIPSTAFPGLSAQLNKVRMTRRTVQWKHRVAASGLDATKECSFLASSRNKCET